MDRLHRRQQSLFENSDKTRELFRSRSIYLIIRQFQPLEHASIPDNNLDFRFMFRYIELSAEDFLKQFYVHVHILKLLRRQ